MAVARSTPPTFVMRRSLPFACRPAESFRVGIHRSEFQRLEHTAVQADAGLRKRLVHRRPTGSQWGSRSRAGPRGSGRCSTGTGRTRVSMTIQEPDHARAHRCGHTALRSNRSPSLARPFTHLPRQIAVQIQGSNLTGDAFRTAGIGDKAAPFPFGNVLRL